MEVKTYKLINGLFQPRNPDDHARFSGEQRVVFATDYDKVLHALEESLKLQSHYAYLLNAHDGGERIGFATADKWIARLAEQKARAPSNRPGSEHGE
jgi:hypothetical protein